MTGIWQDILAGATVLAAVVYLARQLWLVLARTRASGCGAACGQCTTGAAESKPLVSLEVPQRQQPPPA
jgi:hypothetical protein